MKVGKIYSCKWSTCSRYTWSQREHIFFLCVSVSFSLSVCVGVKVAASSSSSTPATLVENEVKIIMKKNMQKMSMYTKARTLFLLRGVFSEKYPFFPPSAFSMCIRWDTLLGFFRRFAFSAVLNVFLSKALYYLALRWKEMPFVFFSFVFKWNICICSPFRCVFSAVIWFIRNVQTSEHILKSRQVLTDYFRVVFSKGFIFFCTFVRLAASPSRDSSSSWELRSEK